MQQYRHWIFDLDGTLTEPLHNFDKIRRTLDVPKGKLILEYIETLGPENSTKLKRHLAALEEELAAQARVARGAASLLNYLRSMGYDLAILTRNTRANALLTLQTIGLLSYFQTQLIIGREETTPKPSKDGVVRLLGQMNGTVSEAVIVGDHRIDLETGTNSGISTIHICGDAQRTWSALTDYRFPTLSALLKALGKNMPDERDK